MAVEVKASAEITLSYVIDIQATYRYYLLQASTLTKPTKPTVFPPSSTWDDTEPSYTDGSTNGLYFVDCTVFCDDTFSYSEVSLSSSYEAAKAAYNKAVNAQNTANTANDKVDNLEIGGRNIFLNSKFESNSDEWHIHPGELEFVEKDGKVCAHIQHTDLESLVYVRQDLCGKLEADTEYTVSGWVMTENIVQGTTNSTLMFYNDSYWDNEGVKTWYGLGAKSFPVNTSTGQWVYLTWTFKTADAAKHQATTEQWFYVYTRDCTGSIYFCNLKLERGNKATDWTPAPEDVDQNVIDATDDVREAMTEQDAALIDQCKDLIDEAGKSYPSLTEYIETKQSFESLFEKTDEAISASITKTTTQIAQVDGTLQTFKTALSKHIEFSADNAITIGGGSNGIILTIDNDKGIIFSKFFNRSGDKPANLPVKASSITYQLHTTNASVPTGTWSTDIPKIPTNQYLWIRNSITYGNADDDTSDVTVVTDSVAFGSWDGTDFHTGNIVVRLHERATFGNFAYVPRSDGSLSFLKVGG